MSSAQGEEGSWGLSHLKECGRGSSLCWLSTCFSPSSRHLEGRHVLVVWNTFTHFITEGDRMDLKDHLPARPAMSRDGLH